MDISKAKFMCLGSNCYAIAYLGDKRVHGPVDNMLALKGFKSSISLLTSEFETEMFNSDYVESKGNTDFQNEIVYSYKNFQVVHNDVNTEKFKTELKKRINTFNDFIKNIHDDDNWLIYNIGQFDVKFTEGNGLGENTEEPTELFLEGLEYFKSIGLLDKIIFIGNIHSTPKRDFAKFHSNKIKEIVPHYFDIKDIFFKQPEQNQIDFINAIKTL